MILGAMDQSYGCLKFLGELWVGRACAAANEVELTKMPKSRGRRKKRGGKRKSGRSKKNKMGPARGRQATTGRGPVPLPPACSQIF
jgi:hypothetical protein